MGDTNPFLNTLKKENLSHAYLCLGEYEQNKKDFEEALIKLDVGLNKPGHFIFIGDTFTREQADNLNKWYIKGATADDSYTIAVIAAGTLKTDAQQLLLKVFEEARNPYIFFLFAPKGVEIIETIRSRCSLIELNDGSIENKKEISKFIKLGVGERIKYVAEQTKNKESHEVRTFTEELVRDLINYFHNDNFNKNKPLLENLLKAQNSLTTGHIAPKFILDYVVTVI